MPTIPFPATPLPAADAPREEWIDAALNMQHNTCPFDVSGHPAFTVPCGICSSLPSVLHLLTRRSVLSGSVLPLRTSKPLARNLRRELLVLQNA